VKWGGREEGRDEGTTFHPSFLLSLITVAREARIQRPEVRSQLFAFEFRSQIWPEVRSQLLARIERPEL
jgi:hypothetical protein